MSTTPIDPVAPLQKRLHELASGAPDLKDAVQCYEIILPLLSSTDLRVEPVSITPAQARAKMERGQPLLQDVNLELDGRAVATLILRMARGLETLGRRKRPREPRASASPKSVGEAFDDTLQRAASARKVRMALEKNKLDVLALLPCVLSGKNDSLTIAAESLELDPSLVRTLAQNAVKPALRGWCRQLTPSAHGIQWFREYCFICGAPATLGELQGNEQAKHLRCGNCGADWPFPRLRCAHCGNEDHRTLGYLYSEPHQKIGVEVCHGCHSYLKIIAAFDATPAEMLPVEDLATLHLDYIAQERGYGRGSPVLTAILTTTPNT